MKTAILSVIYQEPDWHQTVDCIANHAPGYPVFFVDRKGTGSLAEAFNRGFKENNLIVYDLVWFLTNVRFGPRTLQRLEDHMWKTPYAAIHPAFESDHHHLRPKQVDEVFEVAFVEFTAPLVRSSIFANNPLDERMPYAGHDLDWGYRVRYAGHLIGVYHGVTVEHTYIRHNKRKHPVTALRANLRAATEEPTKQLLAQIYGENRQQKLGSAY